MLWEIIGYTFLAFCLIGACTKQGRQDFMSKIGVGFYFLLVAGVILGSFWYVVFTGIKTHGEYCGHPECPDDFIMRLYCDE